MLSSSLDILLEQMEYRQIPTRYELLHSSPPDLTRLRSFLGLVNQLSGFSDEIGKSATPLRDLLKPKNEFYWTTKHEEAMESVKAKLSSPPTLAHFDATKPTRVYTDASRLNGFGFVIKQQQEDGCWSYDARASFYTENRRILDGGFHARATKCFTGEGRHRREIDTVRVEKPGHVLIKTTTATATKTTHPKRDMMRAFLPTKISFPSRR